MTDMQRRSPWGVRVRELRNRLGLTQAELAKLVGCNRATICDWEKRFIKPWSEEAWEFEVIERQHANEAAGDTN